MKTVLQVMSLLWLILPAGCGNNGNQAEERDAVLKTQTDALKKAKQIDQTLLDAAAKQREDIEEGTQ